MFYPMGDSAVCVQYEDTYDAREQVQMACAVLGKTPLPGVIEWVPGLTSITFYYLPHKTGYKELCERIQVVLANTNKSILSTLQKKRTIHVPICYGGEFGPDLEEVARVHRLTTQEVVQIHSRETYLVNLLGFIPGFPYLGGMSSQLATPRLETPRQKVPQGSVGIAGELTGIYPFEISGGWRIIGRTPLLMFNVKVESPFLLQIGDRVRFQQISASEFVRLEASR